MSTHQNLPKLSSFLSEAQDLGSKCALYRMNLTAHTAHEMFRFGLALSHGSKPLFDL